MCKTKTETIKRKKRFRNPINTKISRHLAGYQKTIANKTERKNKPGKFIYIKQDKSLQILSNKELLTIYGEKREKNSHYEPKK